MHILNITRGKAECNIVLYITRRSRVIYNLLSTFLSYVTLLCITNEPSYVVQLKLFGIITVIPHGIMSSKVHNIFYIPYFVVNNYYICCADYSHFFRYNIWGSGYQVLDFIFRYKKFQIFSLY